MFVQALLISLWGLACSIDGSTWQTGLGRPLISGSITGLIVGDFTQGMMMGATFELMWLGVIMIGAYVPPDTTTGAILGTAFGILSGEGAVAGVAVALPVAVVMQQLGILRMTINISILHKADKDALTGDFDKTANNHYLGFLTLILIRVLPLFLAVYVGVEYVTKLFEYIPPQILKGLQVAGSMLPALGFAMLLSLMMDKTNWIFYILGFAVSVYLKVPTIGVAMFAIVLALLLDKLNSDSLANKTTGDNKNRRDL